MQELHHPFLYCLCLGAFVAILSGYPGWVLRNLGCLEGAIELFTKQAIIGFKKAEKTKNRLPVPHELWKGQPVSIFWRHFYLISVLAGNRFIWGQVKTATTSSMNLEHRLPLSLIQFLLDTDQFHLSQSLSHPAPQKDQTDKTGAKQN
jgi:hypothetical protein